MLRWLLPFILCLTAIPAYAATTDVAGDGIDEDSSGYDTPQTGDSTCCGLGSDKDQDGWIDSQDCEVSSDEVGYFGTFEGSGSDSSGHVQTMFPGRYVEDGTAGYVKMCQSDGTYTTPVDHTSTPWTHPDYSGRSHYYASPTGSGTTCSYASPCALGSFGRNYGRTSPADNNEDKASDAVIYLLNGTYSSMATYSEGCSSKVGLCLNTQSNLLIMAYPGATATIDGGGDESTNAGIYVFNSTNVDVLGLAVTGCKTGIIYPNNRR